MEGIMLGFMDNRWVVPHNRELLIKYGWHINVEWCNQSRSIKYLFKYINKGNDRVTAAFYSTTKADKTGAAVDEVKDFFDCRYISPCEAAWRLFKYEIQFKDPPVMRLPFQLPNQKSVIFADNDMLENVERRAMVSVSMFEAWFEANKKYPDLAKDITCVEYPMHFVWKAKDRKWVPRERGRSIGRLHFVALGAGEICYLKLLLNVRKGCKSFDEIMYIDPHHHTNFRDACYALGLLEDDKEYIDGIEEASKWATGQQLRSLFATLLSADCMSRPEYVWEKSWILLYEDFQFCHLEMMDNNHDLELSQDELKNRCLLEIDSILRGRGKRLAEYRTMSVPSIQDSGSGINRFIAEEMQYNKVENFLEFKRLYDLLNEEQRLVYNNVMNAVYENHRGVFFVYGYGGTGKTFIWKTLSSSIRSKGDIILNVDSSGIASLLLPGGRTGHSRLIIWDEASMMHKHCFESLDRTLNDIMKTNSTDGSRVAFGGKVVVLGGDFRQIFPVVPEGSRQDVVNASINSSYLWRSCIVLRLTKNMRLRQCSSSIEAEKLKEFADWIASVGDGTIGPENDGAVDIDIPTDLLVEGGEDPIGSIIENTYPGFQASSDDCSYLNGRAILAPTLDMVDEINEHRIGLNKMDETEYLSSDKCMQVRCRLLLKLGTPVILLRNIDHSLGLCNGTRMVITKLAPHVIEDRVLEGTHAGDLVLLPRMTLTPSDTSLPFRFQRRQFPVIVSYAMTIKKSQGQSLTNVGLYLKKPVFSHGQLYVAVSRVSNRSGLKILACDSNGKTITVTQNVVYKEIFQNL